MNQLLKLLHLSDPALPIGGFSHSYGLETYVQEGVVRDRITAEKFITGQLKQNIQFTDAAFASFAYDAAKERDLNELAALDEECSAVKLPKEIRVASQKLGLRLLKIFAMLCHDELLAAYKNKVDTGALDGHYSIAFGLCSAVFHTGKEEMLTGYYYNTASAMVTNAVKLIPLGQQEGQELLFSLHDLILQLVGSSMKPDPGLLGLCCSGFDIRCMQHERLYSRLYMS